MIKLPKHEHSLWRDTYHGPYFPSLEKSLRVDVVIVGAGITGLTTAYLLKERGLHVAVIEKDTVGGGTTGRTTGKVTSQHGLCYAEMTELAGESIAKTYGQANEAAIAQIESIIKKEKIDCDWRRSNNYVYTTNKGLIQTCREEVDIAQQYGLPVTYETNIDLPFTIQAAVCFKNQAQFAAQKYLLGLAHAVNKDGSFVFENSAVRSFHHGAPCYVTTKQAVVTARDIVVATSVPTLPLMARGSYCFLEYPTESYIVAGPYTGKTKQMYISPDKTNYSILPVSIDNQEYLLIGGGGHVSGLRLSKRKRFEKLASYAEKNFGIQEITHMWSDRDYVAYDKIPLIGRLYPWSTHLYVGTAYRKWGLTNGTVAAMIITDLITGKQNPWAKVFSPQRVRPLKYIPRAVKEQAKQLHRT